ncbi:MAG: hypothetical protein E6R15_02625 [Zoogloea sp.]|nr:MAG: hypothetical protein E6R15_02625 [Zoogloea sp.]
MARFPDSAPAWPSIVPVLQLSTVLHLLVIGNLIAMTMALAYGKNAVSRNPVRLFVLSKLLQAAGWTLINLRGEIPLVLSAHVGNPLIMTGFALEAGLLIIPWRIRSVLNLVLAAEVASGVLVLWLFARSPGELVACPARRWQASMPQAASPFWPAGGRRACSDSQACSFSFSFRSC